MNEFYKLQRRSAKIGYSRRLKIDSYTRRQWLSITRSTLILHIMMDYDQ